MNLIHGDHDIHRFEDDGAPVILKDQRPEKERNRDRRVVLGGGDGLVGSIAPVGSVDTPKILDAAGKEVSSLTWKGFLAWRKTKCRPFNYKIEPSLAQDFRLTDHVRSRSLEEIDQATHEFVGEVAELGHLFIEHGPTAFLGEPRKKLIDECGDILFCGAWALDAWGSNPLYEADDLELVACADDSELAIFARFIVANGERVLGDGEFLNLLGGLVFKSMLTMQTNAGLLCNSFKKLKFQRRTQDVDIQVDRVIMTLFMVNQILVIANSSVEEALRTNQRKLNARYPDGYQSGQGGGIRTGEGK